MFSIGTHNSLFTLNADQVREDLEQTIHIKVRGMQEVSDKNNQRAVEAFCKQNRFGLIPTWPIPIIYDPTVVTPVGSYTMIQASPEIDKTHDPARYAVQAMFRHNSSEKLFAVINTHGPKYVFNGLDSVKKRKPAAKQHWCNVASMVASTLANPDLDTLWVVGDFNVSAEHQANWFDPANVLSPFVKQHSRLERVIDWIAKSTQGSAPVGTMRSYRGNSDHAIRWTNTSL